MTLPGVALAASIDAQWNVGTGGTKPDPIVYLVSVSDRDPNPTDVDAIFVYLPLGGTKRKFNNSLRNAWYFPRIECHTITSTARLEQIMNEVDRIVSSGTVITGATRQQVLETNDISDRAHGGFPKYIVELQVEIFTQMESSATSYGTATVATLETDELTVNDFITGLGATVTDFLDEDDMASDSAVALATQQSIKAYIDAHNMIGSANAEWVPFIYEVAINTGDPLGGSGVRYANEGAIDNFYVFTLPIPITKGGLNLFIADIRLDVNTADATDYVTAVLVQKITNTGNTSIVNDGTNRTTQGSYTYTVNPDVSCENNVAVKGRIHTFQTTTDELIITGLFALCYYA